MRPLNAPASAVWLAALGACAADPSVATQISIDAAAVDPVVSLDASAPDASAPLVIEAGPPPPVVTQAPPTTSCKPATDADQDGFTTEQGDCNDCDALINPGAFDFPGNMFDEDCSGTPAERDDKGCDEGLDLASSAAEDAARAIGLCKFTDEASRAWGVIEARFTTADGTGELDSALQVGLLPAFGAVQPRAGKSLLALSSGVARAPDQPGYTADLSDDFRGGPHKPPMGFPKRSSTCDDGSVKEGSPIYNQAALELKIRVPTNASSLGFDSIFYSYEYPDWICLSFNDFFITLLEPHDEDDGNIVFDAEKNPIGVNTGLLAVCDPAQQDALFTRKRFACEQGTDLLQGTGFGAGEYRDKGLFFSGPGEGGASTGWLTTVAPVKAGSVITLRFAIWDTADYLMDSTVLIDRFTWSVEQPSTPTTEATPVLL